MPQAAGCVAWADVGLPPHIVPVPLDPGGSPEDPAILGDLAEPGSRYFLIAPRAARLRRDLHHVVQPCLDARPDVRIFYGDDAVVDAEGRLVQAFCKPSFNHTLLLAQDYVGFPLLVHASVFRLLTVQLGWRSGGAWYRLLLEAASHGLSIERMPRTLLVSVGTRQQTAVHTARREAKRKMALDHAPFEMRDGLTPGSSQLRRRFRDHPLVTLVVPTRQGGPAREDGADGKPHVAALLDSLRCSTWPAARIRVLIGDDCPSDALFRGRNDPFEVVRLPTPVPAGERFNYAAKMNRLWRAAETEHLVLMNDDITVGSPDWLEALMTFAMQPDVGGVGGRLLFPDGTIQHAGMFGGIFGVFAHPWYRQPAQARTYQDWALVHRECSIVTGALFATRRSAMEAVNGFDEGFSLDFNDVDLCLRMRLLGYRIVYTPFAEMTHHEKGSRRSAVAPGDQVARALTKWRDFLADDPMFSPQLRTDTDVVAPRADVAWWAEAER